MAITYPLSMTGLKKPRRQKFIATSVGSVSRSPFNLTSQTFIHPGQLWRAEVELAPMVDVAEARAWLGFLLALDGRRGSFNMGDFLHTKRGTASACTVTGAIGDRSVSVTMTGTLLAGDYLQLGSGTGAKFHMVTQDRSGSGTMEIWPALRNGVSAVAADITSPVGNWRLDQDNTEFSIEKLMYEPIVFNAVENL